MAPCVLIFEDLDSMVTDEIRSYFLNEVDGLDANDGILMIGSTNHLDRLDPAIAKRPSRFDRKYHFRLPNAQDRALYCRYWAQKLAGHPLVAFPEELCPVVAGLTEGFSFAYLKELFVASLLLLARGGPHEDVGAPKSDSGSSTDAVVIEPDEAAAGAIANTTAAGDASEDGAGQKDEKRTNEKTLPKVEVPESLQGNTLLGIITAQAQSLLDEMDNTDDGPTTTTQVSSDNITVSDDRSTNIEYRLEEPARGCLLSRSSKWQCDLDSWHMRIKIDNADLPDFDIHIQYRKVKPVMNLLAGR